ncbi:MAG: hypothetical protein M3O70_16225, partial [Actinomycetota bacterium]|nr:hypothetical protein [Actinomycetota bacterium]
SNFLLADHRGFPRNSPPPSSSTLMRAILAPPYPVSKDCGCGGVEYQPKRTAQAVRFVIKQ